MNASSHQLAEGVFMCLSDSRFVFLDLRRDQYLCLNGRDTLTATRLFTGFQARETSEATEHPAADAEDIRLVVQTLEGRGLLAQGGTYGKAATSVRIQAPENVLLQDESSPKPTVRPGHWAAFFHASIKASWMLRWYSMQRTVRSIDYRKQRHVKSQTADQDALRKLVATFHHLRPFYVRKYLCLYDSLALVEFLAHYHHFPQWVFGVRAAPFNAHCWIQENDCVLNDSVELVSGYTPIMVV